MMIKDEVYKCGEAFANNGVRHYKDIMVGAYVAGANCYRSMLWHTVNETPRKDAPLLLFLDDGSLVEGTFDGKNFTNARTEIVKWLYVSELL